MKWFLLLILCLCPAVFAITLAENGKTNYTIVPGPTPAEKTAAAELADFLHQSTGAIFPIADHAEGAKIEVRYAEGLAAGPLNTDGIVIQTNGNNLLLSGGIPRGPINAVHTFLEDQVGCRWWTSSESTIPHRATLSIDDLKIMYVPTFRYRETFYYNPNTNAIFSTRLRNNGNHPQIPAEWGGHYEILGFVHTSDHLIPPAKYFKDHPDWFAMVKGKRQPNSQLCLSNEAMRQELVKHCMEWIKENPSAGMISISQNDTFGPCECDECKKTLAEEGAQSGAWIRFVNKCAEDIGKQYPDFLVETLAYQYTRKPPKVTKPANNVIVRLCSIECDFAHPLAGETNSSFGDDLRGWAKIAPNLFIWNYTTSFADYLIPHPNLYTIGDDLQFFAKSNVVSVFQEGDYHNDLAGDMLPLRVWVMAHLMWNPEQDTQALVDEFCNGYYGPAGPQMIEYVKLVNAAVKNPKFKLTCGNNSTAFLSDADLAKADELFDLAARAVANDAELSKRVRRDRLALDHVHLLRYDFASKFAEIKAKANGDANTQLCADYQAKAGAFIAAAPKLGVRHFSEGEDFSHYAAKLLTRCDRFLSTHRTSLPRIEVSSDHQSFVRADTREAFHPWGLNYDRDDSSRLLEEYWANEWPKVEADFREMKLLGANLVRVHLQVAAFMDSPDKPNEANLQRLAKLCDLANDVGLYLDLTGLGCYRKEKSPKWFGDVDDAHRWAMQANFWAAIAKTCANKLAVFDYDLVNEPAIPAEQRKPGDWLFGSFGEFSYCQFVALNGKGIDRNKLARDWAHQMLVAIRSQDKQHMITIGMLPFPGAFPIEGAAPELDYISVHIYPEKEKVGDAIKTLKQFAVGKPVIIEETFPMKCSKDEEKDFLLTSRPAAAGAIGFYWGKPPEELRKSEKLADAFLLSWLDIFQDINPNKP